MARDGSAADRQKAYRERKAAELNGEVEIAAPEIPAIPQGRAAPELEDYVAAQLERTRVEIAAWAPGTTNVLDPESRLARCEKYARWRHAGFLAGEIASL